MARRPKPAHYRGPFHVQAMKVRDAANSDPTQRCWRCRQPIATCGPYRNGRHKNGKPAHWTAGHVIDGQTGGQLLPECSPCATSSGATYGNALRGARRARRKRQTANQQPTSTRW